MVFELSDVQLVDYVDTLTDGQRRNDAELLRALGEMERRELYLKYGCSSLFTYLVERKNYSEGAAAKRAWVARICLKYPMFLDAIASGDIHMAGVQVLSKHLTEANHRDLLLRAKRKSKRAIEELVVEIAPKPAAPTMIRALPPSKRNTPALVSTGEPARVEPPQQPTSANPVVVTPLAPQMHRVQVKVDTRTRQTLEALQDLMPGVDAADIMAQALSDLLQKKLAQKAAVTDRPRKGKPTAKRDRHIPAAIRREVWQRDDGQCTFTDHTGYRCSARRRIEFHHINPYALGGEHSPGNLTLRCQRHNQMQALIDFGQTVRAFGNLPPI